MPIRPENRARYPKNWAAVSLRIRTERAGGRCECDGRCGIDHGGRCAALNKQPHPVTGSRVVLTVAHLDHQPENVDEANLMAACQRCHLRYDRDHHRETAARNRQNTSSDTRQLPLAGFDDEPRGDGGVGGG